MNDVVEQLENRSGGYNPLPEVSVEVKNQILMLHRQLLATRIKNTEIQQVLQSLASALGELIQKTCVDLGLDSSLYTFDLDTLSFQPIK